MNSAIKLVLAGLLLYLAVIVAARLEGLFWWIFGGILGAFFLKQLVEDENAKKASVEIKRELIAIKRLYVTGLIGEREALEKIESRRIKFFGPEAGSLRDEYSNEYSAGKSFLNDSDDHHPMGLQDLIRPNIQYVHDPF